MAIVNNITANCESNQLSQQMISRQWDDKGTLIQFSGYPEPEGDEALIFRLIVWMKESEDAEPRELPPILLDADQWLVSNYYTQLVQTIKFQLCITNESGTFEKHSPIFAGHIGRSLSHNGQEGEIDVIPLFDPYKNYVDERVEELIVAAGDVQIDASLKTSGAAADAKATGDAIDKVNGRLSQRDSTLSVPGGIPDSQAVGNEIDALVKVNAKRGNNLYNLRDGYNHWYLKSTNVIGEHAKAVGFVFPVGSGRHVFRIDDCPEIVAKITARRICWQTAEPALGDTMSLAGASTISDGSIYGTINPSESGYAVLTLLMSNDTAEDVEKYARELKNHLVCVPLASGYNAMYEDYYIPSIPAKSVESKLKGKKIWWCGTSIPAQVNAVGWSYPMRVGDMLGATVFNEAKSSSMCRANVRTGDYVNAFTDNLIYSLAQTVEEKQYIIDNWATIKNLVYGTAPYESLDDIASNIRATSFERKLMPYLDGTNEMPDIFVFDHGHNDWKKFYALADNTPDIGLEPTVANISGNVLAEDTYMTANSNAKLAYYFGEIGAIPSAKLAEFVASVNRNCFIGAVNFLCTLILSKNPRAKILFVGNYELEYPEIAEAQEKLSKSWNFPLVRMWEYTGFSKHYIPSTAKYWNTDGTVDLTAKQVWCKDGVHPASDTTGEAVEAYATTIANMLNSIY